ncbi:minor capsid protein [Lactobacillus sp.]|uniref:phage head morphogenesis protein n=1 Tax=Lactobacillus sp. TaxID=1591 RepID=UPI0019A9C785|nr:minor capsid protein [Lactobacillus sp.]MBD5430133.1 minor capsid protein [Lactobacillus sp.]
MSKEIKIPPTRYPIKIEDWYFKTLQSFIKGWKRDAEYYLKNYINPYIKGGSTFKLDADGDILDRILESLKLLDTAIETAQSDHVLEITIEQFIKAVDNFSYNNSLIQMKIIGLNPIEKNSKLDNYFKTKIHENVQLIKGFRDDYSKRLEGDIYRSITDGGGVTSITENLTKRTNMAVKRAKLIAVDQTGTIISQVNAYRAKSAGAEKYRWQSMEDQRVRPKHRELDGKVFAYDDPHGGDDGKLPGEPIRCRCVADPVFED